MSLPKLYKYSFTVRLVLPNGTKAAMSGEVFDQEGYPESACEKAKDVCAETMGPKEIYVNAVVALRKNRNPVQRIKIKREPPGIEGVEIESCYFCKCETRYWHVRTNTPVCPECATTHAREEIKKPVNIKSHEDNART
jgi:hypothetical protein